MNEDARIKIKGEIAAAPGGASLNVGGKTVDLAVRHGSVGPAVIDIAALYRDAHPMAVMVGTVGALSAFYHDSTDINDTQQRMVASLRLVAKMPTIAAMAYKYHVGQPFVYPVNALDYSSNFLRMCFAVPSED